MTKTESIYYMQSLGLNTLECLITKDYHEAIDYLKKNKDKILSMRTERGYEFLCPFHYGKSADFLAEKAYSLIKDGYTLLIYPYLDYKDSLGCGAIAMPKQGGYILEYYLGPGTVRQLDSHPDKVTEIIPVGTYPLSRSSLIQLVLNKIRKVEELQAKPSAIVEFSIYPYNVGVLQENIVFWEVRDY